MGCGGSKNEAKPDGRLGQQRRRKRRNEALSNIEDVKPSPRLDRSNNVTATATPSAPSPHPNGTQTLESRKASLLPGTTTPAGGPTPGRNPTPVGGGAPPTTGTKDVHATPAPPPPNPPQKGPVTATIDPGKKITLRQAVQLSIQIAKQQRERVGKFQRQERHSVMELYEIMGLDRDEPLAPQSDFQARLSAYNFPPPNMHMLREVEVVDESTMMEVLGEKEFLRRKNEGTVEVKPAAQAPMITNNQAANHRRVGISAEVTKAANANTLFKDIPKTREQTANLSAAIRKTILFRGLESSEMNMLFKAFESEEFGENTVIFEKGDDGDRFYLIEKGRCQILLTDDEGQDVGNVFVGEGDTFGELGVMYGTPRAATIVAVLPTVAWWIDRDTYRGLLLVQTVKKRERFNAFLRSIDIFSSMDEYERTRIADVLDVIEVPAGTVVVREGEPGDSFYMIEEGTVEVSTESKGSLGKMGPSRYFGELALLFDKPRQATIRAATDVKLCVLGRANFANYLGPFENILRRNADQYKRMLQAASQ